MSTSNRKSSSAIKRSLILLTFFICIFTQAVFAAPKLAKVSLSIDPGKTYTLKLKGNAKKKKVKWSVSNKSVLSLSKKTKTSVRIKAKKVGSSEVKAKISGKTLVCRVNVRRYSDKKIAELAKKRVIRFNKSYNKYVHIVDYERYSGNTLHVELAKPQGEGVLPFEININTATGSAKVVYELDDPYSWKKMKVPKNFKIW